MQKAVRGCGSCWALREGGGASLLYRRSLRVVVVVAAAEVVVAVTTAAEVVAVTALAGSSCRRKKKKKWHYMNFPGVQYLLQLIFYTLKIDRLNFIKKIMTWECFSFLFLS